MGEAAIGGGDVLRGFGEGTPFGGEIGGPPVELLGVRFVDDEGAGVGDLDADGAFVVLPVGAGAAGDAEVVSPGAGGEALVDRPVGIDKVGGGNLEGRGAPGVVGAAGGLAGGEVENEKIFGELFGEVLAWGEGEFLAVDLEGGRDGGGGGRGER